MARLVRSFFALALTLCSLPVSAAEPLQVDAMYYPGWLLRDYQTMPLFPGTALRPDDLIRTGDGGRVQLQLADGSRIRLGQQSRMLVQDLPAAASSGVQAVSLRILRGVFHVIPASSATRFRIDLGDVSASFEDADVWGRADPQRQAICLLEGEVEVESSAGDAQSMQQALSCYVKPQAQAPLAVDRVDLQQHRLWLDETELKTGQGIVVIDGQWQLVLISLSDANRAERLLADYRELGIAARRKSVVRNGRTLHRLLLPAFESKADALGAAGRIEKLTGARDSWVWRKPD